ncbi:heavy metal-(Cd/Co/Hg/Pb/Zn)-translocating P-type ATPase [Tamaricihabitans halophyticus]|uniref:Heavy metal-(Cd/Co/Hg/Pb/Zn)-translocating P-type ATPase n=1 Tax=Tamaricihabitans halophyticus TaxID=1262583 RepID=A0A4V2SR88_9PSEU|nr:heavy metal-(Cd/Co/Hg/Pb/Zn)-translocating P-type ATPase [Tamaricihabitans halophyticus]
MSTETAPELGSTRSTGSPQRVRSARTPLWALTEARLAGCALLLFLLGGTAQLAGTAPWLWWTLYLGCYAAGGWQPALDGMRALRERTLDVDLLMVLAAIGAASIGQIFDGALLIVIFATSGALEAYATQRTADSVRSLLELAPTSSTRIRSDGATELVDAAALEVGDRILVRPGERVGADGAVLDGVSEVDESSITGEPLPADKAIGDEVFAGTLNGSGSLTIGVARAARESVLARVVALVEQASATKAPTQLFIEKIEQRYSVGVVLGTLALFAIPLSFGADLRETLLRAMTFMIVASPCAIVLATMPPLLSAMANAGRHGVLVKSAVVMEQLGTVNRVAFDKTGTITEGATQVTDIRPVDGSTAELLGFAAAAEQSSEHPLGRAIVRAARAAGTTVPPARDFRALPGIGVTAVVAGRTVTVRNPRHADAGQAAELVTELETAGHTAVLVSVDGQPLGVLGIGDRARQDASAAIGGLGQLTDRDPLLLTGDNQRAAARLGAEVGITDVRAGLLPEDKVEQINRATADGDRVLLVGDGINDAPALAAAHIGMAMGKGGSDLALETADAVVVHDQLSTVPAAIAISRRARRLVKQNLVIAGTFIAVLVTWDLVGTLPLPVGVAGHEGSTIIVALNGLRMLRRSAWRANQP